MARDTENGDRGNELATAAGISVAAAAAVGAVAAAGRAIRRDPGPVSEHDTKDHHDGTDHARAGAAQGDDANPTKGAPPADSGIKPEGPEDLHKPTFLFSLKMTAREFGTDQCTDIAASLVYYAVLALGPAVIAIVSILGLFSPDTISNLSKQVLQPALPPGTYSIVDGLITNATKAPGAGVGLVIGILGALWSASGYVGAFGRAMNRIYSIPEGRPVWKLRPTQLGVTVLIVVLVVLGAVLLVSAGPVVEQIAKTIGLGAVGLTVFQIVKWPILIAFAIIGVAVLYYFSPNVRQPKLKWTSTGSLLALIVWALATAGLGLYLSLSGGGSYSKSYGPIAGVIIFLLWLWITNLALLFGAEFDAELERSRELRAGLPAEEQIQLPLRDTRQSDKKAAKHEEVVKQARTLRLSRGRRDE